MVNRTQLIDSLFRAAAIVLLCAGLGVALQPETWPSDRQRSLRRCVAAFLLRRADALPLAEAHRTAYPSDLLATLLAAEARGRISEHTRSIELFEQMPQEGGRWEFAREMGVARRCFTLGWLDRAERALHRALALNPESLAANDLLGKIFLWEGRAWEAVEPQFRVLMGGQCRGDELVGVTATDRFIPASQDLDLNVAKDPSKSVAMKIASARGLAFQNKTAESERLLREIVAMRPELGEAQGRLGRIIADRGDTEEFLRWRGTVPAEASSHPEVLFVEGLMARRLQQTEGAAHCFLRALELSPDHLGCNIQVAICLEQLDRPELAAEFSARGGVLSDLETKLNLIRDSHDEKRIKELADLLGKIGRCWEAAGWNYVVTQTELPREVARQDMRDWLTRARARPDSRFGTPLPTSRVRLSDFAPPRWPLSPPATRIDAFSEAKPSPSRIGPGFSVDRPSRWGFDDDARRAGIEFTYFEGTTEENRLKHIFNVMGGGLGALDFDQDGWPDLYIAQANNWESPIDGPEVSDRLYRNLDGARFTDATRAARLGDSDFSHGVTAGDFNQDGFPDVYVGNLGPNRLYENLGDGTFDDATPRAGVAGNEWSTSSVFADLNQDGLPDLYVLNYTEVEGTRTRICRRQDGQEMACTPDLLPADYDRLYLNEGDGRFRDVSEASGIVRSDGRGLGVVAWDFDGNGQLGLFVGNDTTENFLFVNQAASDGSNSPAGGGRLLPSFVDEALVRGCAFDVNGNAQATMGIAAGDVTGDGLIDMLTTNFFADASTLYVQTRDGSFEDRTRELSLREPSYSMLGFGCQFSDFDLDGWEDAIVTNGHVDQRTSQGGPDRMRPQLFRNLQGRTFSEVASEASGDFFQSAYIGRGLAVFDWNRDGLTDVGISHLHAPFALLTNRTVPEGRPLSIRLVGRRGCREPTGSSVTVRAGSLEMTRLLTAGDGFLATNERRLLFSVPSHADEIEVTIRWPGKEIETIALDAESRDLAIVEGTGRTFVLRRFPASSAAPPPN